MIKALGVKKRTKQEDWLRVYDNIDRYISKAEVDDRVQAKVEEIKSATNGKDCAIAWSGGKDSLVVQRLAEMAGITKGVYAYTGLEYPAFMAWVARHIPKDVQPIYTGHDLDWLKEHPQYLFPKNSNLHGRWYGMVQQKTVREYFHKWGFDMMLYGRRRADGNHTPKGIYTNGKGVTIYNCIAEWEHELVLGFIKYYRVPLPPIYQWENGFIEGTHSWNARNPQDKKDATAWAEIYRIDKNIVKAAARHFESAKDYLQEVEG